MKRVLGILTICMLVASVASAAITGSKHDFSSLGWNGGGEICAPCHTPHNANGATGAPLWNHSESTATFTLYSSTTLDATVAAPAGVSKLCLSCHDGTVALDSFGGATGSTNISGTALVGTDLSNDHPVSFTYNTALATTDGGLKDPATDSTVNGLLFSGKMECASCHDVHNGASLASLLRISNASSALCLTCHVK